MQRDFPPDLTVTEKKSRLVSRYDGINFAEAMKIINMMFNTNKGGTEQAFLDYGLALQQSGHKVIAIVKEKIQPQYLHQLHQAQIKTYKIEHRFGAMDYFLIWQLRKLFMQERADIVIAHNGKVASIARRAAKHLLPVVGVNHSNNIKRSLKCDGVLVVNHHLSDVVMAKKPSLFHDTFVIPNMLPHDIPSREETAELRLDQNMNILFVGRLVPEKRVDVLLRSIQRLQQHYQITASLFICGDGDEMSSLQHLAAHLGIMSQTHFLGWTTDLNQIFAQTNVFCLPSLAESFGIVTLDAMSHRKAVVVTETDGSKETVQHLETGLVVINDRNPDIVVPRLAESLYWLHEHPHEAQQMANQGYEWVRQHNTHQQIGQQLTTALHTIIEHYNLAHHRVGKA